jgi:hypothetical protein
MINQRNRAYVAGRAERIMMSSRGGVKDESALIKTSTHC